ncbi:dicarboxylate/amino acid:cation symporter [Clostridium aestuarii]|uniref:Dicarboxylate/amino acid:cation symporter n=1 Tax=Clostridium aestuarii TaxID=338193 RepID=A0ABT4D3L4_9CLOT|nr:dicarboxylate/amino acid:cation symporter [Clostridium aestuarii]MCY6485823.1 dicarboxylate/amino acid:cation symporter [Clostridium aestuarii]
MVKTKNKKMKLTSKILLALALGVGFGIISNLFFPANANELISKWVLEPVGKVFLRAIKMIVVPLVLCSLIAGVASMGDIKKVGRIGGKIVAYYMMTTAFAISIALVISNIFKPGNTGMNNLESATKITTKEAPFIMDIFVKMVPVNPIKSMVEGNMLQIIFFAILFGLGITIIGKKAEPLLNVINQANEVLLKIIGLVMLTAPYGVFALISKVIMFQGIDVLEKLFQYVGVVIFVLIVQAVIVYGIALKILGKVNPIKFYKKFWPVMVVAFSTSSSNATIPVNLEACEEKLGIPERISSFTIPLGATINMDGTAVMQGVAAIFIANVYGMNLSLEQQLMVILTATLASIGTAGVPSAGVVMLTMVLQQVGLPIEGAALVLSVDRIVDMFRTTANITGDAIGTLIVANSENELDLDVYNSEISVESNINN